MQVSPYEVEQARLDGILGNCRVKSWSAIIMLSRLLIASAMLAVDFAASRTADASTDIVFPGDAGVINIAEAPYFAKGDGVTDDTDAINLALMDHNVVQADDEFMAWTIYFPAGTYLVSDTLQPRDPRDPSKIQSTVRFVGQGIEKTTIKLKDHAPGFNNPDDARYVIRTGSKGKKANSGFGNYIEHLTVDVGAANSGAIGVRFDVANCGAMRHVRIVSTDSERRGKYGLGFFSTVGPGYVNDVEIEGFAVGIYFDRVTVNNLALENIHLKDQRVAGIENAGKNVVIRSLTSMNAVPALRATGAGAATILIDARAEGRGSGPAIELAENAFLYVRDLLTTGYVTAIDVPKTNSIAGQANGAIDEWWSHEAPFMSRKRSASLRLPIRDAPEYENPDPRAWQNVAKYGAKPNDGKDDSIGFQKAIDSGKEIVYSPRGVYEIGFDLNIRGNVKKVDFLFSHLKATSGNPAAIRVGDVSGGIVILDNLVTELPIIHDSPDTVVIRDRANAGRILTGDKGKGDLFIENVGPHISIEIRNGIHAWLRSINREDAGFLNEGSTVWYLADNIERMQIKKTGRPILRALRTVNGKTELIGGAMDALWVPHTAKQGALLESINSSISAVYAGEVSHKERWGSWPLHVRVVREGSETMIGEEDILTFLPPNKRIKRIVMPLFSTE